MYFLLFYVFMTLVVAACLVAADRDRGTWPKLSASVIAGLVIGLVWPLFLTLAGCLKFLTFFWPKLK